MLSVILFHRLYLKMNECIITVLFYEVEEIPWNCSETHFCFECCSAAITIVQIDCVRFV